MMTLCHDEIDSLRADVDRLNEEVTSLRTIVEKIKSELGI
jgi:hypothetical protein